MTSHLQSFVENNFYALKKYLTNDTQDESLKAQLRSTYAHLADHEHVSIEASLPVFETLVGSPVASWHAGHLFQLKGETLPNWDKRDAYIRGFAKSFELEELQRKASDTLAQMKLALLRDALERHAQLYDASVQAKMSQLITEMLNSPREPLLFLKNLATQKYRPVLAVATSSRPSNEWMKKDKTTELVCQLASLTLLEIEKTLSNNNTLTQKNSTQADPTSPSL